MKIDSLIRNLLFALCASVVLAICVMSTCAQVDLSEKCRGPVYDRKEVTRPAKLIRSPDLTTIYNSFGSSIHARVKLNAIFCRSGRITNIHVVSSDPAAIGEFVAAALSLASFQPAELNWHTVSQRQQFEFDINESAVTQIDSTAAAGRVIESINLMGYRRTTRDEIMNRIKSRPGDSYSSEQVQKDLKAILATGQFDALRTRVILEEGIRGGVGLTFEVVELPLIVSVTFAGLKEDVQGPIVEALRTHHVDLQKGTPLDDAKLKQAKHVIENYLESKGWREIKVETFLENLSATEVAVTFKVTAYKFGS